MKKTLILFATILNITLYSQSITYTYNITWSEQQSGINTSLNAVSTAHFEDSKNAWACGDNGVVLKTTDEGLNWVSVGSNGIPVNVNLMNIAVPYYNTVLTSGNSDNTACLYRTDNGGQSWTQVFSQVSGKINAVYFDYSNKGYIIGNPVNGRWSLWKSTDFGITWDSAGMFIPQNNNESGWNNSCYVQGGYNGDKIWFGTNNHRIYYSGNSGNDWIAQNFPEQNIYSLGWIGMNVIAGGNNLYTSSNYGTSWNIQNSTGNGEIKAISVPQIILITPVDNFIPATPWLYIRNNNKIFYTDDGGAGWNVKYQSESGNYKHMNSNYKFIWAVKDNGGITRGKIDVITSIPPNTYPYSFELLQNYPNPFNPKTNIRITIYKTTTISLNVYNSTGKLVWKHDKEYIPLQIWDIENYYYYEIEWNGTNYPSGIYYYQVIADDYSETKKMALVK